jgi:hypothetical protein
MKTTDAITVRQTPAVSSDSGKVRLGDYTPLFPAPVKRPARNINDGGKVRIGDYTPMFPPLRSR